MSFPKTTRYGADPLVDPELATKKYVDDNAGGGGFYGSMEFTSGGGNTSIFHGINTGGFTTTTNSQRSINETVLTIKRWVIRVQTNSKGIDIPADLLDDAVSILSITILNNTTGTFSSGEVTLTVAVDSEFSQNFDRSVASGGTLGYVTTILGIAAPT